LNITRGTDTQPTAKEVSIIVKECSTSAPLITNKSVPKTSAKINVKDGITNTDDLSDIAPPPSPENAECDGGGILEVYDATRGKHIHICICSLLQYTMEAVP